MDDRGTARILAARATRFRGRPQVFPLASSVIRDAPNGDEVIAQVARATGARLQVLPGA